MDLDDLSKWIITAVVLIAIVWAPVSCVRSNDDNIAKAIAAGVDPVDARCAYKGDTGYSTTCAVRAGQRGTVK
jgi:hypothetical protein